MDKATLEMLYLALEHLRCWIEEDQILVLKLLKK